MRVVTGASSTSSARTQPVPPFGFTAAAPGTTPPRSPAHRFASTAKTVGTPLTFSGPERREPARARLCGTRARAPVRPLRRSVRALPTGWVEPATHGSALSFPSRPSPATASALFEDRDSKLRSCLPAPAAGNSRRDEYHQQGTHEGTVALSTQLLHPFGTCSPISP